MSRQEPDRLTYPLGSSATAATLPETSATVASTRELFPYLTQIPVSQGGAYPRRQDINALIKTLGASTYFTESGGVWSYDADRAGEYAAGDIVWYDPGADLYADLPVSDGEGGYTVDTVLLSAVAASSGYPAGAALLFVRNQAAAGSGSMTPVVARGGLAVVNASYWSPILGLEQYARLYDAVQHAGGGDTPTPTPVEWATVGQVLDLFRTVSPVLQIDTSELAASGQSYIYITDADDNPIGGAWPGTPLTMTGTTTGVWSSYLLPDTEESYTMIISAGDRQTGSIDWLGVSGLQAARGHLIRVADGSSEWEIIS